MSDLVEVTITNKDVSQWIGDLFISTRQQAKAIEMLEAKIREMGDEIRKLREVK